jgi:hypothetical protein
MAIIKHRKESGVNINNEKKRGIMKWQHQRISEMK